MTRRLLSLMRQQPIALLALFIALSGSSYAAVSSRSAQSAGKNVIYGCVAEKTGRLRVVDRPIRCGSLESPISFNREGDRGPRGKRGNVGPEGDRGVQGFAGRPGARGGIGATGAAGLNGVAGKNGAPGAAGLNGADGIDGAPGRDGLTGPAGRDGRDGRDGAAETAAQILAKLTTVDGSDSGLDADTLDGLNSDALVRSDAFATLSANAFDNRFPNTFDSRFPNAFDTRISTLFGTGNTAAAWNTLGGVDCTMAEVSLTAATYPPPGTAFAAGQVLSISSNSALFSLLGTNYGGDGQTTFALPDLRKQAPGGTHYTICHTGIFPGRD